jgi:peptide/nickel transport system substrate-binding protein
MQRRHVLALMGSTVLYAGVSRAPVFAQEDTRPTLVVAVADLPTGLEPVRNMGNPGTRITYSVFDTLIRRDFLSAPGGAGAKLVPSLATEWKRNSPSELIVTLRQGVKFHNGDELTADDVAFTFSEERMWGEKPMIPDAKNYFGVLSAVEAVDKYTVRFQTRVPDVLLEQRLASWASWIVNKRAYQELGIDQFALHAVGTGPYKMRSYTADSAIVLDAFDDYWMGKPTAKSVEFREVPEVATRVAGLISNEFDIITNLPPEQIETLSSYDNIEARSVVLANAHLLTYNMQDPVMADKRIRQALNLAIDRQTLVDSIWEGQAVVPPGHNFPEYGDMFIAEGHEMRFDPEKAKQLLAEAGYAGQPIVYRTLPNYYTGAMAAAEILIEMWKAVGINAQLQVVENFDQMADGMQIGNTSNSIRIPDPLGSLWVSWGPNASPQVSKQWLPESAAKFNEAGRKLEGETDPAKRKALFETMLTEFETEAPATILYQPLESYGVKKNIKWQPYTFYYMDLRPYNLQFTA